MIHAGEKTYAEIEREDIAKFPYEVYHPEGFDLTQMRPPKFRTWKEALGKQVEWNRDCPGHKARRRKVKSI